MGQALNSFQSGFLLGVIFMFAIAPAVFRFQVWLKSLRSPFSPMSVTKKPKRAPARYSGRPSWKRCGYYSSCWWPPWPCITSSSWPEPRLRWTVPKIG